MTAERHDLDRRTVLAGLSAVGAAAAGAGLGTTAYFSDEERYEENRLVAGSLDMKVAWQEHYSNWLDDDYGDDPPLGAETRFAQMPEDGQKTHLSLPPGPNQPDASSIDLAFVDEDGPDAGYDSRPDEADGGRQFLRNTRRQRVNGGLYGGPEDLCVVDADVPEDRALLEVTDLKPGDFGAAMFRFRLCDNPGYLWLTGSLDAARENGVPEAEADDPDEDGDPSATDPAAVELLDAVQVAYAVGTTNDVASTDPAANPLPLPTNGTLQHQTTLRDFLDRAGSGTGIPLAGDLDAAEGGGTGRDCFPGGTDRYASVVWWLPIDHGNQVQTDSVTFDLGFYAEQCRHNPGTGMAPETLVTLAGDSPQGQGAGFANPWDTTTAVASRGSGAWGTVDHGPNGTGQATDTDGDSRLEYKQGFYFGGEFSDFDVLPAFTVADLEEIAYDLFEPSPLGGVDIYLTIYTQPEGDGDDSASWYDSRLQALPAEANGGSPTFTPGQWNTFSTRAGATNTLAWADTGRGGAFAQPLPTLADLQAGPLDWSSYGGGLSATHDYTDETIRALSLQTGSESGVTLEASVDNVVVRLASGAELVLDLEA